MMSKSADAVRILVAGAGATGGYFGARLALAGRDVTFLVRAARALELERDGLQIVSPHGDATLRPKLVRAPDITAPFDLVLLAVKGYGLDAALEDLRPAIGEQTTIVPLLNGLRHMDVLRERFGPARVVGGMCLIISSLDDAGRIVQSGDVQELAYGAYPSGTSERVDAVDRALRDAGFTARASTDIARDMWEKWVMLAALGGITCLMRGAIGEVAAAPGGVAFARALLGECAAVARAAGYPMTDAYMHRVEPMLTAPGSTLTSSMYRDLASGKPVEAGEILGDLVGRARATGIDVPLVAAAFAHLDVYTRRLRTT